MIKGKQLWYMSKIIWGRKILFKCIYVFKKISFRIITSSLTFNFKFNWIKLKRVDLFYENSKLK